MIKTCILCIHTTHRIYTRRKPVKFAQKTSVTLVGGHPVLSNKHTYSKCSSRPVEGSVWHHHTPSTSWFFLAVRGEIWLSFATPRHRLAFVLQHGVPGTIVATGTLQAISDHTGLSCHQTSVRTNRSNTIQQIQAIQDILCLPSGKLT